MANYRIIEKLLAYFGMARAVYRLGSDDYRTQLSAVEHLHAAGTKCFALLRKKAFRGKPVHSLRAASLLHDLGDYQGLWALMELLSKPSLTPDLKAGVRAELERIGQQEIISSLETALDRVDQGRFLPSHWSLALCVHVLRTIDELGLRLNEDLWLRLLTLRSSSMDDMRVCRMVTPVDSRSARGLDPLAWPAGSSLVQIRRCAVDILLKRRPERLIFMLKQAISSTDKDVQLTAMHALWRLGDRRAIVLLQPIAVNRQHPYSREARRAIESFGSSQPDELTLVRAAESAGNPGQLLRSLATTPDVGAEVLLRPGADESLRQRK